MTTSAPFPDWATGYEQYQPLFFDALSRLAMRGYVVQPADAADLIQSFFADAWKGLSERYNPGVGPVANYLYGAFVRFARQRVDRLQKWDLRLRDLADVAEDISRGTADSPPEQLIRREEQGLLEAVLGELPPERRAVLLEYFAHGARSQRALASQHGTTRYRLRELLINGFGQLVARLTARDAWPAPDQEVAHLLWCEGCDLEEAADRCGRPLATVKQARDRLVKHLAADLAAVPAAKAVVKP